MKNLQKYLVVAAIALAVIALVERIEPIKKIVKGT